MASCYIRRKCGVAAGIAALCLRSKALLTFMAGKTANEQRNARHIKISSHDYRLSMLLARFYIISIDEILKAYR